MYLRIAATVLFALATVVGALPWSLMRMLAAAVASAWRTFNVREHRVARRNVQLAFPQLDAAEQAVLHRAVMRTTALQALETLRFWTRPHARNLQSIRQVHGAQWLDAAIAAGRGVIVAAPHFGNWELLNQWLSTRTDLAILYRAPESAIGEAFLRRVRRDARVTQVRAEAAGIRELFKRLRAGGVVGILPDQQPKVGEGDYAPFFGRAALTMTLLGRLAERSHASVVFAWCERIDHGPTFALHIESAPPGIDHPDPAAAVAALNQAVERIARRDPAQYQWTYKRWSRRPPGSNEPNPYNDVAPEA